MNRKRSIIISVLFILHILLISCSFNNSLPVISSSSSGNSGNQGSIYFTNGDIEFSGDPDDDGLIPIGDTGGAGDMFRFGGYTGLCAYINTNSGSVILHYLIKRIDNGNMTNFVFSNNMGIVQTNSMMPGYIARYVSPGQYEWENLYTGVKKTTGRKPLNLFYGFEDNGSSLIIVETNIFSNKMISNYILKSDTNRFIIANDPCEQYGIGCVYMKYNSNYLYLAHKPAAQNAYINGHGIMDFVISVNDSNSGYASMRTLNADGLSAAGLSGSFISGDQTSNVSSRDLAGFFRHRRDYNYPATPIQANYGTYTWFLKPGNTIQASVLDNSYPITGPVYKKYVSSNGVVQVAIPWTNILPTNSMIFDLGLATHNSTNWIPLQNRFYNRYDYWLIFSINRITGTISRFPGRLYLYNDTNSGGEGDLTNAASQVYDYTYYAFNNSVTCTVRLQDKDWGSGSTPALNVNAVGSTIQSRTYNMYWNPQENCFTATFILATNNPSVYYGENIIYFNQNGSVTFNYQDGMSIISKTVLIKVVDVPGIQLDGYMDPDWTNTSIIYVSNRNLEQNYSVMGCGDSIHNRAYIEWVNGTAYTNMTNCLMNDIVSVFSYDSPNDGIFGIDIVQENGTYKKIKGLGFGIWVANLSSNSSVDIYIDLDDGMGRVFTSDDRDPFRNRLYSYSSQKFDCVIRIASTTNTRTNFDSFANSDGVWVPFSSGVYYASMDFKPSSLQNLPSWVMNASNLTFIEAAIDKDLLIDFIAGESNYNKPNRFNYRVTVVDPKTGIVSDIGDSRDAVTVVLSNTNYNTIYREIITTNYGLNTNLKSITTSNETIYNSPVPYSKRMAVFNADITYYGTNFYLQSNQTVIRSIYSNAGGSITNTNSITTVGLNYYSYYWYGYYYYYYNYQKVPFRSVPSGYSELYGNGGYSLLVIPQNGSWLTFRP